MQPAQLTQSAPELELSDRQTGAIRYIEHGYPNWRVRWHYHDEYELHLIVATSGKMFMGDYIGSFQPGNLTLAGPRLPHNWISQIAAGEHYDLRDQVVHFDHDVIVAAADLLPELRTLLPLMERARHGIEFLQPPKNIDQHMRQIKESTGIARLSHFCTLMDELVHTQHYRLLSAAQIDLPANEGLQEKINCVVNYAMENYPNEIKLGQVAELISMSESYFSRFFRKATGNRFSDFINRIRISKACDLLSRTDKQITLICYEVGFNNVANFNRRFYEHKNITPRDYRKQVQQRFIRGGESSETEMMELQ